MSNGHAWSQWEERLVRQMWGSAPLAMISTVLPHRTPNAIKSHARVLGVRRGNRKVWTAAEDSVLRERYPHESSQALATRFGCTLSSVYERAKRLGLEKTAEYLASPAACALIRPNSAGVAFRFPKGHVPANKGLRRPGYAPGRMAETQFRKGRLACEARNYVPIGSTKFDKHGYLVRKVTDDPTI